MTHRTAILSDIEAYLDYEAFTPEVRAEEIADRNSRLLLFPNAVLLQVAYPELDFANRWCWNQFGPADGECTQKDSYYRICEVDQPHSHSGSWMTHWLAKTDYDLDSMNGTLQSATITIASLRFYLNLTGARNFPNHDRPHN